VTAGGSGGRPGRSLRVAATWLAIGGLVSCGPADAPAPDLGGARIGAVYSPSVLRGRFPASPSETDGPVLEGGFALASSGSFVYALDVIARSVLRFDLDGRLLGRLGRPGRGPGELSAPIGLAAAPDGSIWVADPASGRLVRFDPTGGRVDEIRAPLPPVNLAVVESGSVLLPTTNARTVLARVAEGGTRELEVDPALVPPELRGGLGDRVSLRGLALAGLSGHRVAMLRNRHGTDFRLWTVDIDGSGSRIAAIRPTPLPEWLYGIMREETEAARRAVSETFAEGDFLVPFKGVHAAGGRVWLVPTPSSRLIALSVGLPGGEVAAVVVGDREVWEGLLDALVVDGRLVALYHTELRVYELEEVPDARRWQPGSGSGNAVAPGSGDSGVRR